MTNKLLTHYWLDWGFNLDPNQPADPQIAAALAQAAKLYAVKFGVNPTRALIHNSQLSDELAVAADVLDIQLESIARAYNKNRFWLSRLDISSEDICLKKNTAQEILCHTKSQ